MNRPFAGRCAPPLMELGFQVAEASRGEEALQLLRSSGHDVVLLDINMPGIGGIETLRRIRAFAPRLPVLMLTVRDGEEEKVEALELGADDYVTKPFSSRILSARVRAVLRRRASEPGDEKNVLVRGAIEIDRTYHSVKLDGEPVTLTLSEFKTIDLFMRRPGVVFSRYQIVDAVHGDDYPVTDRSVDVQIVGLRRKLGKYSDLIETVRGVGYRMRAE